MSEDTMFEHDALSELAREVLEESDESAYAYLVQSWLSSAIEKLYDARRHAGLTQKEVAERLGTKQPAIARLERDDEGRVSLHRYIEFALACGLLPLDISLRPAEDLRRYAIHHPEAPRSEKVYEAWRNKAHVPTGLAAPIRFDTALPHVNPESLFKETEERPKDKRKPVAATAEKEPRKTIEAKPESDFRMSQHANLDYAA